MGIGGCQGKSCRKEENPYTSLPQELLPYVNSTKILKIGTFDCIIVVLEASPTDICKKVFI